MKVRIAVLVCMVMGILLCLPTIYGQEGDAQSGGTLRSFPGAVRLDNPAVGDWRPNWVLDGETLTIYEIDPDLICEDRQATPRRLLITEDGLRDPETQEQITLTSDHQPTQVFGWLDDTQILLAMAVDFERGPGPAYSGGRLEFTYACEELFVLDTGTGNLEQVTDFEGELGCVAVAYPALSPDATALAFTLALPTAYSPSLVHVFEISDRERHVYSFLMEDAGHYTLNGLWLRLGFFWSPDSRYLAFSPDGSLTVLDTVTGEYYFTYEATQMSSNDPPRMPAGVQIEGWCRRDPFDPGTPIDNDSASD